MVYEAVVAASPSPPQLAAYAGRFVNADLGVVYEVRWEGAGLLLRRPGYSPSPLAPAFADAFSEDEVGLLRFSRESNGVVCGLTVLSGAQALEFSRLPANLP